MAMRPGHVFGGSVTSNTGAGVALPPQGCHSVTVKSDIGNVGTIYVGDENVDANAFDLQPGEAITLPITDASSVFHMASVNGLTLRYIGVT
jgi:hypothetical protein